MGFNNLHAIANILNFLLFVFIVVKFAGPAVRSNVAARKAAALAAVREATEANLRAAEALELTKARLSNVDTELADMIAQAKEIATKQGLNLEEAGRREAERLRAAAKAEIERERQIAVQDIRKLLLQQAFDKAALELQQSMTAERQRELVSGLIQKVGDGSLALK